MSIKAVKIAIKRFDEFRREKFPFHLLDVFLSLAKDDEPSLL